MGIRENQWYGITVEAGLFLDEHGVYEGWDECPHCGKTTKTKLKCEQHDVYEGGWEEEFPLMKYPLANGGYALEVLQDDPWDCGPMIYTKLEVYNSNSELEQTFQWPFETIYGVTEEEYNRIIKEKTVVEVAV